MQIHVIIGEDDYLIGETARKTVGDGVGLEVIDSMNASNADLQLADLRRADESLSTPPFLDPKKVTWWKNVGFLPGGKVSEDVKTALEKFAEKLAAMKLPENQHFILSGPRLLKTSIFAKRLAGAAEVVTFTAEKPWEALRNAAVRAEDFAEEVGLKFAPGASDRFVAIVGTDARSLASEIAKMRDYLGAGATTIAAEDVAAIASPGAKVEAEVWDVTDAVGERNAAKAMEAMRKFELENGFAVFMSGILEKLFRQLLDVKEGRTEGMNPYAARKNAGFAAKWTLRELKNARARFLALREKVVSGTTAGDTLVVTELLRVLRRASAAVALAVVFTFSALAGTEAGHCDLNWVSSGSEPRRVASMGVTGVPLDSKCDTPGPSLVGNPLRVGFGIMTKFAKRFDERRTRT